MTIPTPEERIANLEGSFAQIATRLDRVEIDIRDLRTEMNTRFDRMEQQFTSRLDQTERDRQAFHAEMPPQFDLMEQRWDARERRYERLEYLLLVLFVALVVLMFARALM